MKERRQTGFEAEEFDEKEGEIDASGAKGIFHVGGLLLIAGHAQKDGIVLLSKVNEVLKADETGGSKITDRIIALKAQIFPSIAFDLKLKDFFSFVFEITRLPQSPQKVDVFFVVLVECCLIQKPDILHYRSLLDVEFSAFRILLPLSFFLSFFVLVEREDSNEIIDFGFGHCFGLGKCVGPK